MLPCVNCDSGAVCNVGNSDSVLVGSPPHVCELGEGSPSLSYLLNNCPVPQSYSALRPGHQL